MTVCNRTAWLALLPVLPSLAADRAAPPTKGPLPEVTRAFEEHVRGVESRISRQLQGDNGFLWATTPERRQKIRESPVVCEPAVRNGEIKLPHGLIHDWVGAVFIPNAGVDDVLSLIQDYDNHKNIYKPEVIDSKTLERRGDDFKVRMRVLKKKVITVVLETEHEAHYYRLAPDWCRSESHSTRIAEIENYGEPDERERPAGQDRGFLWRLNSYWAIRERDRGAYVECEAVSLTRGVPAALRWLIDPIVRSLARDSLVNTLHGTRAAVLNGTGNAARPAAPQ